MSSTTSTIRKALSVTAIALLVGGASLATLPAQAQSGGFITGKPALLKPMAGGVTINPILTTGDQLSNGYTMAAVPDGLGAFDNGDGTFTLYMNHELTAGSSANLTDARISKLTINKDTLQVVDAKYVVTGSEGFKRFCSATLVGPKEGFDRYYYLTGEEDTTGKWGGISVVLDSKNDVVTPLVYMGRMRWENVIAVPGFKDKTVLMGFDDTAPGGVYMYVANSPNDVWTGKGNLYVFVADGGIRTEDKVSKGVPITGRFVQIDQAKASMYYKGLTDEAEAAGYFKFVRPEDGVYDPVEPNTVYFNVTGRSQYTDTLTGKPYDAKGRVYQMKFDPSAPTRVTALKSILDGDAGDDILNPDNIAASQTHLMLQEDINSEYEGQRAGRVTAYEKATGKLTTVAEVSHRDFSGQPIPNDKLGMWESSGITNASDVLGKDMWLLDVQAHSYKIDQFSGKDEAGQLLALMVPGSAQPMPQATPQPSVPLVPVAPSVPSAPTSQQPATPPSVGDGSNGNTMPGMPRTGQSSGDLWVPLFTLGALATASGIAIRRKRVPS